MRIYKVGCYSETGDRIIFRMFSSTFRFLSGIFRLKEYERKYRYFSNTSCARPGDNTAVTRF
ncbi:MAG: hypothetical protein A2X94_16110 [Bdellovibrionales bacterium GWB1_55_8]|nr:MAG: hypothetical protein A2X94_16110 [Bdellovibrionales bacterium GWB1_55_8]